MLLFGSDELKRHRQDVIADLLEENQADREVNSE